mgnify:CR=1 FL=1|tara:strand:+ start:72 stop:497 length:426 start_codon:yes stop_codon:yes gene_type:complete
MNFRIYRFEENIEEKPSLKNFLINYMGNFFGLAIASLLITGVSVDDLPSLVAATAIFAIIHTFIKPFAYLVSCCLIAVTFGFFIFVINALLLIMTSKISTSLGLTFNVENFISAFLGALVITVISSINRYIFRKRINKKTF